MVQAAALLGQAQGIAHELKINFEDSQDLGLHI